MNKSLLTNLVALGVVGLGLLLPDPWRTHVLTMGLFALSGGVTNWLAVYMLFERVPGLYGSGVVPLHFEEFKSGIRQLVMRQFFSVENIDRFFSNRVMEGGELDHAVRGVVEQMDLDKVFDSLVEGIMQSSLGSMLGMFGGADALENLRKPFRRRIREHLMKLLDSETFRETLRAQMAQMVSAEALQDNIADIVNRRLEELTPGMVKDLVQNMMQRHLGWLVVWGAVIGGLIGLVFSLLSFNFI